MLTGGAVPSLPHLSLAPGHRRGWGSVYAALRRGHISFEALRSLLVRQPMPAGPPLYAVDVSVWPRPGATTSPERGYQYHSPRRRDGRDPVVPGWAYQWLTRLSWDRDSWTAPVDVRRVRPEEKPTAVAVEQLKALVATRPAAQRGEVPLVLFDAGYDASGFTHALAGTPGRPAHPAAQQPPLLVRPRPPRRRPRRAARSGTGPSSSATTRPPGPRRPPSCASPTRPTARCGCGPGRASTPTCAAPSGRASSGSTAGPGDSPTGRWCAWRSTACPGRRRTPDVVWLWWQPPPEPGGAPRLPSPEDLDRLWRGYCRSADLEQTFRFLKQVLRWVTPRVRLPEQADRWTWLVLAAYTQLRLARGAVADHRLPWERPLPPARLTPARVHRSFATLARCLPPVAARQNPAGAPRAGPKGAARRRRRAIRPSRRPPDPRGSRSARRAAAFAPTRCVAARAGVVKRPGRDLFPWRGPAAGSGQGRGRPASRQRGGVRVPA